MRVGILVALVLAASVHPALARQSSAPGVQRFTLAGGVTWLGSSAIGSRPATLRRNEPGTTTPTEFTLFNADASLERTFGADLRVGFALTRAFTLEVAGGFSQPALAASISGDPESEPIVLADQRLSQFTVDGSLIWRVPGISLGARATPYVIGGAGYLRQIDADRVQAESGTVGHVGGGVRYWLRGNESTRRALGVRGEVRLQVRSGGFELEDKTRLFPAVHLLAMFGF